MMGTPVDDAISYHERAIKLLINARDFVDKTCGHLNEAQRDQVVMKIFDNTKFILDMKAPDES